MNNGTGGRGGNGGRKARGVRLTATLGVGLALSGCASLRPDCLQPAVESDAAVTSAACVVVVDGQLLTIRHRFGGRLGLPGGTARAGEPARCVAERETWEETGLLVRAIEPVGPRSATSPVFQCELVADEAPPGHTTPPWHALPEVLGVYWLEPEALTPDDWRSPGQLAWLPGVVAEIAADARTTAVTGSP